MDYTKDFLGRGWAFPVAADNACGRVQLAHYEDDIAQAIRIILSTRKGERVMRPDFGSRLHTYLFSTDGYGMRARIKEETAETLRLWEPRIVDIEVEVEFSKGPVGGFVLHISYVVRSTNNPFNLVFPYFLTEGV